MQKTDKNWIVYLSSFPPRECGIATFTEDLSKAFDELFSPGVESKVVALNTDAINRLNYPAKVIFRLNKSDIIDYARVARELNQLPQVKLVNIQHEFGLHGGTWGKNLLVFMREIEKPVVTTFHTVLPNPDPVLKEVVSEIASRSERVITMTNNSRDLLLKDYSISHKKIVVIPHGIHAQKLSEPAHAKTRLLLKGKTVLSTFGLLSDNKGIEYVLGALPKIIKKVPNLVYLIIGATHPVKLREEGEKYRNFLTKKVYDLGLQGHVRFYNRYLSLPELLGFLEATDVYLSTSLDPNQAVSGTLSYALGAGRPVISTAFAQAKEDITPEVGILVPVRNSEAFFRAALSLLEQPDLIKKMGRAAFSKTRNMTWPNVAIAYMKVFSKIVPLLAFREKNLPYIRLTHLLRMTDKFGMYQFSNLTEPDPKFGYTVDDNARALIATCLYYEKFRTPTTKRLIPIYLNFLKYTLGPDGYFKNYVNIDKSFNEKSNRTENMEDATSRALHALAVAGTSKTLCPEQKNLARKLYFESLKQGVSFKYLRSAAFFIKSLSLWLSSGERVPMKAALRNKLDEHCALLVSAFKANSSPEWQWFEDKLTYANAALPDALLSGYIVRRRQNLEWFEIARQTLEFLIAKNFIKDIYIPTGQSGWHHRNSIRAIYDQQPEEPSSMVVALRTMYEITKDEKYRKLMYRVFYWFLGDNTVGRIMYDPTTGGCYDGLSNNAINLNQGAESTVSYLIARLSL